MINSTVEKMDEDTGYIHLKVKITKDFYIPVLDYKLMDDEHKLALRKAIEDAISRNINGWQWSNSHIAYQRQDDENGKPKKINWQSVPSESNIIYVDDVNR